MEEQAWTRGKLSTGFAVAGVASLLFVVLWALEVSRPAVIAAADYGCCSQSLAS